MHWYNWVVAVVAVFAVFWFWDEHADAVTKRSRFWYAVATLPALMIAVAAVTLPLLLTGRG